VPIASAAVRGRTLATPLVSSTTTTISNTTGTASGTGTVVTTVVPR
jgi:hypothetical protein